MDPQNPPDMMAHALRMEELSTKFLRMLSDEEVQPSPNESWGALALAMGSVIAFGVEREHWDEIIEVSGKLIRATAEDALPRIEKLMVKLGTGEN